jgi:hypothetical protein
LPAKDNLLEFAKFLTEQELVDINKPDKNGQTTLDY